MTRLRGMVFLCLALAACAAAQSKPNFSGTWSLNRADSDYSAGGSLPDRLVRTVQHNGKSLRYTVEREKDGRKGSFDVELEIGGAPYESDAAGIVTAEWSGATLVIKTLYNPGTDREASQVEKWTLSADGKKVVDQLVFHRPDGKEVPIKRVFDKQ